MRIAIHAAVAQNGVIGREGALPWRLPTDLRRFKADTMGKPLIMGRTTWEGLPARPLPGRDNIVVTSREGYEADGATVARSLAEALEAARAKGRDGEVCIIGGGTIYAQTIDMADVLHITHVHAELAGDTVFPAIDPATWYVVSGRDEPAGDGNTHSTRHVIYARRKTAG